MFFAIETESRFVKFHAMQSMLRRWRRWSSGSSTWSCGCVRAHALPGPRRRDLVGFLGWALLSLGFLGLWLYCMVRAFQGERFKLPYIGELAEQQVWPTERT